MTDKIEEIVGRAIAYTRPLLEVSPGRWRVARKGLRRIRDDLYREAPDHPALLRLDAFMAQWDRRDGEV
jgi:hypothetical protein